MDAQITGRIRKGARAAADARCRPAAAFYGKLTLPYQGASPFLIAGPSRRRMLAPPQQEEDPVPACLLAQRPTPRTILLLLLAVTLTTSNLQATTLDNAIIQVFFKLSHSGFMVCPGMDREFAGEFAQTKAHQGPTNNLTTVVPAAAKDL